MRLSRFAGTWTAIKCVKDNIESTASVDVSLDRLNIVIPEFDMPPGGLNIRHEIDMLGQEERLHEYKRAAAAAFIRANGINRIVYSGGQNPKIGIMTVGKSYLDVRQALDDLGIDEARAAQLGVRLSKVGCPWPLDIEHLKDFARGLEMIIVVEEKRSLIEVQVREDLYGTSMQPLVVGKKDERGDWLFPAKGALDPNDIAIAIGERVMRVIGPADDIAPARRAHPPVPGDARRHQGHRRAARRFSARAARTTARPRCPKARSPAPASAAISWRCGWTATRSASRRWAARARSGSARRRSPSASISSRISATAPTIIPACWRCASRAPPAST